MFVRNSCRDMVELTLVCASQAPSFSDGAGVNRLFAIRFAFTICSTSSSSDTSESEATNGVSVKQEENYVSLHNTMNDNISHVAT